MPPTNDEIQEQLIAARRNQILDAAVKVFSEKGFHRSTIKDVARQANIADGTIYNYFKNKNDLLLGILDKLNESEQREIHLAQGQQLDMQEFVNTFMRHRMSVMSQDGDAILRVLISEILVDSDLRERYNKQIVQPTYELAEKYFALAAQQGRIETVDVPLVLRVITSMVMGAFLLRMLDDAVIASRWEDMTGIIIETVLKLLLPSGDDS